MASGKRVAVVGSGITGLSSAWLLHRSGAKVTLFEKEGTCGGHTLTDTTTSIPVDLGFQVYNLSTYGNLVGFFEALGVDSEPSNMSFALSVDAGKLEWASHNIGTVFALRNWMRPAFVRMVYEVVRFGNQAPEVLETARDHEFRSMSLGQYLKLRGYSDYFLRHYVLPMCAAVWSVPESQVLAFPVQMLVKFWVNHHLLDIVQRPVWRVVKGRSQEYVTKVLAELPDVRTSCPVVAIQRSQDSTGPVVLTAADGSQHTFDAVVFATHSDITRKILGNEATPAESAVLDAIPYNENSVYLHTDASLMPRNRHLWASWNFLGNSSATEDSAVCVSYYANMLQTMPPGAPDLFVTLNPTHEPDPASVIRKLSLAHPVFSFAAAQAQRDLPSIQGTRNTYYAGAWCTYGFHEDGIKAGIAAATALGATVPWVPRPTSPKMSLMDMLYLGVFKKWAAAAFRLGHVRLILPNGEELHFGSKDTTEAPVPTGEEWRGRPKLQAKLRVLSMDFFRKVVMRHDTGLGEAFMDGDVQVDDLGGFMAVLVGNAVNCEAQRGLLGWVNWLGNRMLYLSHCTRSNTVVNSRKNIEEHYDAGNAMYKLFLDESMTYSAGIHSPGGSLLDAQYAKLDAIIAQADLQPGMHVLEIGCGWGSFAMRAAQTTGCRVTGLTLSKEQLAEATQRVKAAGLEGLVTLKFCDYRDCPGAGTFDRVVSIEMIEAVGHEHLPTYFRTIGRMLRPGGKAVIQAITMPDERYDVYCRSSDFIREHIFPGGHLPSMGAMVEAARGTGLSVHAVNDIGPDYAITLREWRKPWEQRKAELLALGYSERFWQKYRFYFAYCEAAFDARYIRDLHILWVKDQEVHATPLDGMVPRDKLSMAIREELPSDPITQVLLAIYFFLAGLIVRQTPLLWLMPVTSAVFALLFATTHSLAKALLPFYSRLPQDKSAWWCADVAHLVYSGGVSTAALVYLLAEPHALHMLQPPAVHVVPSTIIVGSTGFFAFYLWACVRSQLYRRSVISIVQYTLLLIMFGVAAIKETHVPLLCVTLLAEVNTVFYMVGKLMQLAGLDRSSTACHIVRQMDKATLLLFRLIPHIVLTVIVALHPSAFASTFPYCTAVAGMLFCNYINVRRVMVTFLRPLHAPKLHSE